MISRLRKYLASFAAVAATGFVVAPLTPRALVLFHGSFDEAEDEPVAEVGKVFLGDAGGAISVMQVASGGNQLVFDDTPTGGALTTWLAGQFVGGATVDRGVFVFKHKVSMAQFSASFFAGVVMDHPASDFFPANGPDGFGNYVLGGSPFALAIPLDRKIEVTTTLSRPSPLVNWSWHVHLDIPDVPDAQDPDQAGEIADSASVRLLGLAFLKPAGSPGQFTVDDVTATWTLH